MFPTHRGLEKIQPTMGKFGKKVRTYWFCLQWFSCGFTHTVFVANVQCKSWARKSHRYSAHIRKDDMLIFKRFDFACKGSLLCLKASPHRIPMEISCDTNQRFIPTYMFSFAWDWCLFFNSTLIINTCSLSDFRRSSVTKCNYCIFTKFILRILFE